MWSRKNNLLLRTGLLKQQKIVFTLKVALLIIIVNIYWYVLSARFRMPTIAPLNRWGNGGPERLELNSKG